MENLTTTEIIGGISAVFALFAGAVRHLWKAYKTHVNESLERNQQDIVELKEERKETSKHVLSLTEKVGEVQGRAAGQQELTEKIIEKVDEVIEVVRATG